MTSTTDLLRPITSAVAVLVVSGCAAFANPSAADARPDWQSSMRSAVPADQLGETAYNHVVYSSPFVRRSARLGDDPRSSMRSPLSAEQAGQTSASHTIHAGPVDQHYRAGDGHASMRSAIDASQLGE